MFGIPARWTAVSTTTGTLLTPPGGAAIGSITYLERNRPLAEVDALIAGLGMPAGFVAAGAPRQVAGVTTEGELTEQVSLTGTLAGVDVELTFGFVLLDDYYAALVGIAHGIANHALIRDTIARLLVLDVHLLGAIRRRWYRHAAPVGWAAERGLFHATFTAPSGARIRLAAAVPAQPGLEAIMLAKTAPGAEIAPPAAIATVAGLTGQLHRRAHAGHDVLIAFLDDGRFAYAVRFDGAAAGPDRAAFDALVSSIAPVPVPGTPARVRSADLFGHWAM
jgi:hypothetical protein